MLVLDSSFLISFYLTEDTNHDQALRLAEENKDEDMLLSDAILYETITVLNYKKKISFAKEAYDDLINNKKIIFFQFNAKETKEILDRFFCQTKQMSFADASVVFLCLRGNLNALAFDKNILAVCGKNGK